MSVEIENAFPEISKAIQHRRAEYFILTKESHYVNKMVHHGQIEQNDANNLLGEIDNKIYEIYSQDIEFKLLDPLERIVHLSELADVFTHEELHDWESVVKLEEKTFNEGELIKGKGGAHNNLVYYVSRGEVRERLHEYNEADVEKGHSLKLKTGSFACL